MVGGWLFSELVILAAAYLLGAIPFGLMLAKFFAGVDVRKEGSGNIGATNVARSAGKALGLAALVMDAAKGAAPVLIAEHVFGASAAVVASAGLCAFLGHVFPVYLSFRGGKGVATGLGVFLAIAPLPTLVAIAIFAFTFLVTRVVSLSSLLAAVALVLAVSVLERRSEIIWLAIVMVVVVVVRHRGNIGRLLARSERKI